jgi:hypothetical protein
MLPSGMLHSVALVTTDVSEERIASLIWATRIGVLRLPVTANVPSKTQRAIYHNCVHQHSTSVVTSVNNRARAPYIGVHWLLYNPTTDAFGALM